MYFVRQRRAVCRGALSLKIIAPRKKFIVLGLIFSSALLFAAAQERPLWFGENAGDSIAFRFVTRFDLSEMIPDRNYLHTVSARRVPVHPTREKSSAVAKAFAQDVQNVVLSNPKLKESLGGENTQSSTEYRWHVTHPGKDVLYLKPAKKEIFLPDRNRIFSFYARGAGRAHQVYAIFRGPNQVRQEIFVCSLDFKGWKRFEVVIPPYLRLRNPQHYNRFELFFEGLKIQSFFRDPAGTSVFNFAAMIIMADTSDKNIPGAAMPDDL